MKCTTKGNKDLGLIIEVIAIVVGFTTNCAISAYHH
jgi:hypothetical protein